MVLLKEGYEVSPQRRFGDELSSSVMIKRGSFLGLGGSLFSSHSDPVEHYYTHLAVQNQYLMGS